MRNSVVAVQIIILSLFVIGSFAPASIAQVITVCQCNIFDGGKWTDQDQSKVTYDTAKRFAQFVASVNPTGSAYPPIAVIGMEELMSETDRTTIESYLEQYTGAAWESARIAQGVNNTSGIGFFWRPDLVEYRPEWDLGSVALEQIDNGYVIKFAGRLFRKVGTDAAFGLITGKLVWADAILHGAAVTEEIRRQEAAHLKNWILNGEGTSLGMSSFPGTTRVITTDLNTGVNTATWNEMNLDYTDPSTEHTENSFNPTWLMDLIGTRLDYVWWDYDAGTKKTGGFVDGPHRSPHVGSDHRSVYATINLHPVDVTPPLVSITSPAGGAVLTGMTKITAAATDASNIAQVQFLVDGVPAWSTTTAPYEFNWNASGVSEGGHTLVAIATDASTNRMRTTSAPVGVWVSYTGTAPGIVDVKKRPDADMVALSDKVVTASFGSYFYIEEPGGYSGIKVNVASAPAVGTKVSVYGRLGSLNSEREITATSVTPTGTLPLPPAVGMDNRTVGGGPIGSYTAGIYQAVGPNNVGSLVTCWGKVTATIAGFYIYIDDGSGLQDGYGYKGLRVDISGLSGYTPPGVGSYVRVTGISSTSLLSGKVQRRLKVRNSSDINVEF